MRILLPFLNNMLITQVKNIIYYTLLISTVLLYFTKVSFGQVQNYDEAHRGSIYFNVGYQMQFYNTSTIRVQQDALNNDYNLLNVKGVDLNGSSGFSPMALNFRFGYYFNYNQDLGIEISYDPCKYYIQDNQKININGTRSGINVNDSIVFSKANGNYYNLNNGAGVIQFNFSGRYGLYRKVSYTFALDFIGKAGIGAIMPNVDNSIESQKNDAGFQLAGLNLGLEMGLRWVSHRHYCVDLTYKYNYAMLSNLKIYEGWASQNISSGAVVLAVGVFLPTSKHNPLFDLGWAHRKRIIHSRPMYLIDAQY